MFQARHRPLPSGLLSGHRPRRAMMAEFNVLSLPQLSAAATISIPNNHPSRSSPSSPQNFSRIGLRQASRSVLVSDVSLRPWRSSGWSSIISVDSLTGRNHAKRNRPIFHGELVSPESLLSPAGFFRTGISTNQSQRTLSFTQSKTKGKQTTKPLTARTHDTRNLHQNVGVGCVNVQMRIPFSSNQLANSTRHWVICILILGVLTSRASSRWIKEQCKRSKIRGQYDSEYERHNICI